MYEFPFGAGQQLNLNWIINEIITLHKQLDPDYELPNFDTAFPYMNLNTLNLDWILRELKAIKDLAPTEDATLLKMVANALLAETYDATTQYNVDDIVYRDNEKRLFKCINATPAGGEAWDSSKWVEIDVGEVLTDLLVNAVTNVRYNDHKIQQEINGTYSDVITIEDTPADVSDRLPSSKAVYNLNGAINTLATLRAKMGAKNLLPFPYEEDTKITHGITYAVNSDSSITINGTNTHTEMVHFNLSLGINWTGYRLHLIYDTPDSNISMHYNNNVQALSLDVSYQATINNVTVYPMVLDPLETELNPFEKYAKTNVELTKDITILNGAINDLTNYTHNVSTAKIATNNTTNIQSGQITSIKSGNLVQISGQIKAASTGIGAWLQTLCTLDSEAKTSNARTVWAYANYDNNMEMVQLELLADGTLRTRINSGAGHQIIGNSWIVIPNQIVFD